MAIHFRQWLPVIQQVKTESSSAMNSPRQFVIFETSMTRSETL